MSHIYSALLFEGHDLSSHTPVTLESGFVYVVRDIDVFFPGPAGSATAQVVAASSGGTFFQCEAIPVPLQGVWRNWRGRQVFVPQVGVPTLEILTDTPIGGADVRISGWKLTPP